MKFKILVFNNGLILTSEFCTVMKNACNIKDLTVNLRHSRNIWNRANGLPKQLIMYVEDSNESTGEMNSAELKQKRVLKDG
jgi:hypothetical protein